MNPVECGLVEIGGNNLARVGPILEVCYGPSPDHLLGPYPALIDTGATQNYIDHRLAVKLQLNPIRATRVLATSAVLAATVYSGQLYIPDLAWTIPDQIIATDLNSSGEGFNIIIGRTTLQHCRMVYNGQTGSVLLFKV